jgi:hypothetical protein
MSLQKTLLGTEPLTPHSKTDSHQPPIFKLQIRN